ncbi:hypothetical protein BGZ65_003952 [Modicella reniformis]|uniref:Uncharacterized protein n=1 Tax=Modicella reniformis TaxID=1440133 RepID=A0A9P6J281_9FUNG|nr:hypothetical protein BGZ65_003952 [Modicella reniformis]
MGLFDKFFGVVEPGKAAPVLAFLYAVIGLVFMILSFGRWIMPHAETDLAIPWAVVCLLLMFTGVYGVWANTKGNTWHHRQFVSASWGFLLMFLCWSIVYIAVEENHVDKTASITAIILVVIGMIFGTYFTLVLSNWVSKIEWEEHLEMEKRLELWRSGKGENPNGDDHVEGEEAV